MQQCRLQGVKSVGGVMLMPRSNSHSGLGTPLHGRCTHRGSLAVYSPA